MTSGGARGHSGPTADEGSLRSARRGYKLATLPATAYVGAVPPFPLPESTPRELEVWEQVWRLPQAHAWSRPNEAWRARTIAMWVRQSVRCEQHDAKAAHLAQLHRFADQIGLTDSGLAVMGYRLESKPSAAPENKASARRPSARDRMKVIEGGAA